MSDRTPNLNDLVRWFEQQDKTKIKTRKLSVEKICLEIGHTTEIHKHLKPLPNPISATTHRQTSLEDRVLLNVSSPDDGEPETKSEATFVPSGPYTSVYFEGQKVKAAIVTCGGLCPGINSVIRELVLSLWYLYGVRRIWGVEYGLRGVYTRPYRRLYPEQVLRIHNDAGSFLGSSRGGFDLERILSALQEKKINQIFLIGGDGTMRAAHKLDEEARARGMLLTVAGIPKTIDNDIPIIDRSFGFDTAVQAACAAIKAANFEATSAINGVGLVKLMGRSSGMIALNASVSNMDVNVALIPEVAFDLHGEHGLLNWIMERLERKGHCVIVVAEGVGKRLQESHKGTGGECDASGNPRLPDPGPLLKQWILEHAKRRGLPINLKYVDPTYIIRSTSPVASDQHLCLMLAQDAVHAAMSGFTGFCVGTVQSRHVLVPLWALGGTARVNPSGQLWNQLLCATGQPSFTGPGAPPASTRAAPGSMRRRAKIKTAASGAAKESIDILKSFL